MTASASRADLNRLNPPLLVIGFSMIVLAIQVITPSLGNWKYYLAAFGFLVLALFKNRVAVFLFLLSLPLSATTLNIQSSVIAPADLLLAALFFLWLVKNIFLGGQPIRPMASSWAAIFFFAWSVIASVGAVSKVEVDIIQTLGLMIWAPLLIANFIETRDDFVFMANTLAIGGLFAAGVALLEYFLLGIRAKGILGEPNYAAAYLLMALAFTLTLAYSHPHPVMRYFWYAGSAVIGLSVVATSSRAGWIATLAGALFLSLMRGFKTFLIMIFALVALFFALKDYFPVDFFTRAASITEVSNENLGWRPEQYKSAVIVITREPVFGSGPGNLLNYTIENRDEDLNFPVGFVHNIFLQIGAERGIPALIAFIFLYANIMLLSAREFSRASDPRLKTFFFGALGALVVFLIVNQSAYFLLRGTGLFLGVLLGALGRAQEFNQLPWPDEDTGEEPSKTGETIHEVPLLLKHSPSL